MQTFVPYASFVESAECLDRQRLGKQRVETLQILRTLTGRSSGWVNHPAVKMWKGHEGALAQYGLVVCAEWKRRGYKDTCAEQMRQIVSEDSITDTTMPRWWGTRSLHRSHRSNLLRKQRDHYEALWAHEPDDLPYVWPQDLWDQPRGK